MCFPCASHWHVWTHISLSAGPDVSADVQVLDDAVALCRVEPGGERQRGALLRRGELHLGQIVDEEVQFGGNAAQTGLDQPAGVRGVVNKGGRCSLDAARDRLQRRS